MSPKCPLDSPDTSLDSHAAVAHTEGWHMSARDTENIPGTRESLFMREIPTERFEPLIGSTEASKLLHIHPKTLQRMARQLAIPGHQIGRQWLFRASELDTWLANKLSSSVPLVPLK